MTGVILVVDSTLILTLGTVYVFEFMGIFGGDAV